MRVTLVSPITCVVLGVFFILSLGIVQAQNTENISSVKCANCIRTNPTSPIVDGILDDEVWESAPVYEDFLQQEPKEGKSATEKTTFRVIYDEEAIYFGIQCYDSEPDEIVSRLARRDSWVEADWISVSLDPHYDHQTGYWFATYASGSIRDGTYSNDRWRDDTWNGVWEVETKIHDSGWTAEYRIPYHILRFSPKKEYVWGMNVERNISRKKERDQWRLIRKDEPGLVSNFGRLEGIRNINPPMHLEFIPYAMGRTIMEDDNKYSGGIGTDIRYGITSGISLNATVNPDFGQVESDPASLNLTAFEDYLHERRPFFVEGAFIFENGDYSLFHSRRIGRKPGYFDVPEDAEEIERPESTTILGAAKLTGKTAGKTAFGILEAVTAPEYVTIEQEIDGEKKQNEHLIEPLTNYFVGRINQDVLSGTSKVGLITTAVNRRDAESAYTTAVDWNLKFKENSYEFTGIVAGSRAGKAGERKSGYISHFEFDKRGGWLEGETGFSTISPDLDINDLGFIRRNDYIESWGRVRFNRNQPLGPFRNFDISSDGQLVWNYDGMRLENEFDISSWGELRNYWELHLHFGRSFESLNDNDVRRGGTVIKSPASYFVHGSISTDDRKAISFSIRPELWRHDDGLTYRRSLRLGMELRPLPNVWFLLEPSYRHSVIDAQWVDRVEEQIGSETVVHYVYGELDSKTLDFTTRASICLTPQLSLELYLQPFIAVGNYENFKELIQPETYNFRPYSFGENRDFHRRTLKSNMVLRWEFQPGSTLFVVWSQSRRADLEELTPEDLEFRPFDRLRSSFADDGSNVFLVKLNYWLGI